MKNFRFVLATFAFVCLAFGAEKATAQGNGAISTKFDASTGFYNECCDEFIQISGTVHRVFNPKTGKSHLNFQGLTGTGSNGNSYSGNYVSNSSFEDHGDGSYSGSDHLRVQLSSPSGCSFTIHILLTWTYDPVNGYVQEVKKYEFECTEETDLG